MLKHKFKERIIKMDKKEKQLNLKEIENKYNFCKKRKRGAKIKIKSV